MLCSLLLLDFHFNENSCYIEKENDRLNELEEESISSMTKTCADDVSYYSGLIEYEPEIYEYLKEAEVCLCLSCTNVRVDPC